MEPLKSKSLVKAIIKLKLYEEDNTLLAIDKETTVRFLDNDTLKLVDGFKAGIKHETYKTSVVDYSNNKKYLAVISADLREARLYNTKTKKLIAKVDRHHGEVSCVALDPMNRFMISGGDDGKLFALDVKSGKLMFTLPSHVDTINDIAFTKNSNWVATASYDRKISVFNLVMMSHKGRFKSHSAPVMKLRFFQKGKLLSIDKDSKAIIWDIHTAKVTHRLQGIHDEVRAITMDEEEKFLFVATALGYVLVYDMHTFEAISTKYIKITSPITALEFDSKNNHLILGTEDGFLIYYDIYEGLDTIKEYLQHKRFDEILAEAQRNPILKYTNIFDLVSNLWEKTLEKAKIALQNGQKEKAELMLKQFKTMPAKNKIIQKLFRDFEQYDKFVQYAKTGKLALAYSLANSYPVYKDTKLYKALEKNWKSVFAKAQTMILDPRNAQAAKDMLMPYRGIPDKTKFIQELFTKINIYKRFRDALGKKDFKLAQQLIKQNPYLQELPEYMTLVSFADSMYVKAHKAIEEGDLSSASKYLHVLKDFDDFKEEAMQRLKELELRQKFYLAAKSNNLVDAYDAMAELEDLEETPEGKKLQNQWNEDLSLANSHAVQGDTVGVKKVLEKYLEIPSKRLALANIFSWNYISQIEDAINKHLEQHMIEKGIKNYVALFGVTDQLESLFETFKEKYPKTKLNLELLQKGSMERWRPSMIVKSILD